MFPNSNRKNRGFESWFQPGAWSVRHWHQLHGTAGKLPHPPKECQAVCLRERIGSGSGTQEVHLKTDILIYCLLLPLKVTNSMILLIVTGDSVLPLGPWGHLLVFKVADQHRSRRLMATARAIYKFSGGVQNFKRQVANSKLNTFSTWVDRLSNTYGQQVLLDTCLTWLIFQTLHFHEFIVDRGLSQRLLDIRLSNVYLRLSRYML